MKQLTCEVCGAHNLQKQGDIFVCQSCGCQYTNVDKLLVEVDDSQEIDNLKVLARRARDSVNIGDAQRYYNELVIKNPNDWESAFFSVYYTAANCKIYQIASAANNIKAALKTTFPLIMTYVPDSKKYEAYECIFLYTIAISDSFFNTAKNHFDKFPTVDDSAKELFDKSYSIIEMLGTLGSSLQMCGINDLALKSFDQALNLDSKFSTLPSNPHIFKENGQSIIDIMGKINPTIINYQSKYNEVEDKKKEISQITSRYSSHKRIENTKPGIGCGTALLLFNLYFCFSGAKIFVVLSIISGIVIAYFIANYLINKNSKQFASEENDIGIEKAELSEELDKLESELKSLDTFSTICPTVKLYVENIYKANSSST